MSAVFNSMMSDLLDAGIPVITGIKPVLSFTKTEKPCKLLLGQHSFNQSAYNGFIHFVKLGDKANLLGRSFIQ